LDELSQNIPVFFSSNMSYGVHALSKILAAAVPILDEFDIELTEAHHNKKVDAPSCTLEKLYDVIVSLKENVTTVYDRHEINQKRQPQNIGIHSIR
ncbi:dihydrodipicolinate reductase C-terminal domain-containing protein, partial [Staphylococcus aureus]|nr:dihydrodipicolinate reductase C-terminal domain-containing protein [Staphylococcus aureus]